VVLEFAGDAGRFVTVFGQDNDPTVATEAGLTVFVRCNYPGISRTFRKMFGTIE